MRINPRNLLTPAQAAVLVGADESTVRKACASGRLEHVKLSGKYYTTRTWLDVWLADPEAHKYDPQRRLLRA